MRSVAQIWRPWRLVEQCQHLCESPLQLNVLTRCVVFGMNNHLDIGVRSVVLDLVADILEPVAELGLGGDAAIGVTRTWPDPNDAAPGTRANQRA